MSFGPIVPIHVTGTPSVSRQVAPALPTAASSDSTDRDADGRQLLDTFEHDDDPDTPDEPNEPEQNDTPEPPIAPPDLLSDGHLDVMA